MFRNYFKTAWRNLWRHKLFSFINVFGLALSLLVCLLVMVEVINDFSYDKFHPHAERIYRILTDVTENKNNKAYELASTPLPLKDALAQQKDMAQDAVQVYPALKGNASFEGKKLSVNAAFTSTSFFHVFGFHLASGSEEDALGIANGIVLSNETAERFFGKQDAIGKTLDFGSLGLYKVTGVLQKAPGKSHLDFDAYASSLSIPALEKSRALPELENNWNSLNYSYTYVLLKQNVSANAFENYLSQVAQRPELRSPEGKVNFAAQPLLKITPGTDSIYNEIGSGIVWAKVLTIIGIGLIILLAACFNYTNLTIARALTRAKEVGIRKVSGATRYQVFLQYIVESMVIAFIALLLACVFVPVVQPGFHFSYQLVTFASIFTFITALGAGAFPAWILSSFKPVRVLKNISTQKLFGNISLQKGLMIFQFSLSILVIIFLAVYYRQFSYIETIDTGFSSANIISIPSSANDEVFANEIRSINGVGLISRKSEDFGMRGSGSVQVFKSKPLNETGITADYYFADAVTVPMHQLKIIAGNNFPSAENYSSEKYILINEKAANAFGYKNISDAVNKTVWLNDTTEVEIAGVLKNFYDKGAARNINPLILRNKSGAFNYLDVQVNAANKNSAVQQIAAAWKKVNPHAAFEYQWLDKKIAARDDQTGTYVQMSFLAFITVSIATLGLLGLVIYTVETKQKEISIRKVMGADVRQLMLMLSKGFLKLIVIAGCIAMPIGYIVSALFLQNFPNQVTIGAGTLLTGFLFLLIIGLITILSNTYKASTVNPVKNLRLE